jgi:hypothetical protein
LKKDHNSGKKSEPTSKRRSRRARRDTKEVLPEVVVKLKEKLDSKKVAATSGEAEKRMSEVTPPQFRDGCKLREIVSWQDSGYISVRFRCHRRVEDAALFRVLGQVHKNAAGVSLDEGGFAGAQRVIKILESAPKHRQTEHTDVIAERTLIPDVITTSASQRTE